MNEIKYSEKIKIEHFKNLVAVAFSDDYLDKIEAEFLADKAKELGLAQDIVNGLIKNPDQLLYVVPENMVDKENQLSDIVYIAIIDGVLRPKEYELCVAIAEKLGFNKEYVDEVITLTIKLWKTSKWYFG